MRSTALLLAFVASFATAQRTPSERHAPIFGTYSNLALNDETGDLLGTEIQVLPEYEHAAVLFQCAEGVPSPLRLVLAKVTSTTVDFKIPDAPGGMCPGQYHGTLTSRGLQLSVDGKKSDLLRRAKSYWAR